MLASLVYHICVSLVPCPVCVIICSIFVCLNKWFQAGAQHAAGHLTVRISPRASTRLNHASQPRVSTTSQPRLNYASQPRVSTTRLHLCTCPAVNSTLSEQRQRWEIDLYNTAKDPSIRATNQSPLTTLGATPQAAKGCQRRTRASRGQRTREASRRETPLSET